MPQVSLRKAQPAVAKPAAVTAIRRRGLRRCARPRRDRFFPSGVRTAVCDQNTALVAVNSSVADGPVPVSTDSANRVINRSLGPARWDFGLFHRRSDRRIHASGIAARETVPAAGHQPPPWKQDQKWSPASRCVGISAGDRSGSPTIDLRWRIKPGDVRSNSQAVTTCGRCRGGISLKSSARSGKCYERAAMPSGPADRFRWLRRLTPTAPVSSYPDEP